VRRRVIEQHLESIQVGKALGAKALIIRLDGGVESAAWTNLRRSLDHVIDSLENIYTALPKDWRLLLTYGGGRQCGQRGLVLDSGTAMIVAQGLGPQALCLVNAACGCEPCGAAHVVARLIAVNRLGGVSFGGLGCPGGAAVSGPHLASPLFMVFKELVDASADPQVRQCRPRFDPVFLVGQSPGERDPVEQLIQSSIEVHRAHAKTLLLDYEALQRGQESDDPLLAEQLVKAALETDVSPLLAEVRRQKGGALDPFAAYRHFCRRRREG
jgi:L-rhamnose isomerase/sugar isomerase